jgi:hypothetical protein
MSKKQCCWYCKYGDDHFRLQKNQGHCHCLHPDIEVSGEPGWATLRRWWDTCGHFKPIIHRGVRDDTILPG